MKFEKANSPSIPYLLAALFIITRLIPLIFSHPVYMFVYRMEELYRGAMAQELIRGSFASLYAYRPDDYAGGSFVISAIASLLFRVLPQSVFTLKLVSLMWSGAALFFWYGAVKRFENAKASLYFAILFIFCPPAFLRYSLAPLGDHVETILFAGAELWIFSSLFKHQKHETFLAGLLGIIAGFGIWFAYIHFFAVLTIVIFWRMSNPSVFRSKPFWIFALGLMAGFSPWILINLKDHGVGFIVQGKPVWQSIHVKYFIKRLIDFRTAAPYELFSYFDLFAPPFLASKLVIWFYRILFLTPIFFALKQIMTRKGWYLHWKNYPLVTMSVIYLAMLSLAVQMTEYTAVRYWMPAQPFLFYLIVFSVGRLSRNSKRVEVYFYALIILSASLFSGKFLSFREAGYAFRTPGASFAWLTGSPVCSKSKSCLNAYLHFQDKTTKDERRSLVLDLSLALASDLEFNDLPKELDAMDADLPDSVRRLFYYSLGYEIYARNHEDFLKSMAAVNQMIKPRGEKMYKLCVWGLLDAAMNRFEPISPEEMIRAQSSIPDFAVSEYWRKRGFEWMQAFMHSEHEVDSLPAALEAFQKRLPQDAVLLFTQGAGIALYGHWRMNQRTHSVTHKVFGSLPSWVQTAMAQGGGIGSTELPEWDRTVMNAMFLKTIGSGFRGTFDESAQRRNEELDRLGYNFQLT